MHLILGILWLLGAIGLFGYEFYTGESPFLIKGLNISAGWFVILLALYNFARWYSYRAKANESEAMRYVNEARMRLAQQRERPEPDPTFDFTENPRPPLQGPPSAN